MTLSAMRGLRRGLVLAATGIIWAAGPVRAQDVDEPMPEAQHSQLPPGAVVQPLDGGPGAELRRNLITLAENPRSLEALVGAGRAALGLRDGEAASGFFTRAQEIAPDDPRVKAGMASAMLLSARPEQALLLFAEAVQRGAPEAEIAGDRGLAYDMVGDPRRAQQDYALALRHRNDPEVERRFALSLAISGQRAAALRVIDAQLRRHDRAAWRTEAFVLALTGDAAGADDTARRLMPPTNADAMAPFFARLASLSPAQKAAAVNFGRFPSDGRATQVASNVDTRADPGALAMAQGGPARYQPQLAEPVNGAGRRRPGMTEPADYGRGRDGEVAPAVQPARRRVEIAQAPARFAPPQPEPDEDAQARAQEPQQRQGPVARPREAPAFVPGGNFTLDTSHEEARPQAPAPSAAPGFGSVGPTQTPSVRQFQTFTIQPGPSPTAPAPGSRPAMSDIASIVQALPREGQPGGAGPISSPPAAPSLAERQARDAAAREMEARYRGGNPTGSSRSAGTGAGRHWVQIAHTGQRSALADQYRQVHARAPGLIESRPAWTIADRSTNRLLIGPFDDERGAQDFIAQLDARHIAAMPWESGAGQSPEHFGGAAGASSSRARTERPEPQPSSRTSRGRQAEERADTAEERHSSRSRAGRHAADEEGGSRRSGHAASDERSGAAHGRSSHSASEERNAAHGRTGRSASDDRNGAHGRTGRDRSASDERSGSHGRSGRDRASADDSRSSRGRSGTRHGADEDSRSSAHARQGHGRGASGDDDHGSRSRSGQERRQADHDTRTSRGRSSQEQRPAPHGRRSR